MKRNKFFVLGVLAMALTFGLVLAGCDDGSTGGGDPSFTWPTGLKETRWSGTFNSHTCTYLFIDGDDDYLGYIVDSPPTSYYKDITAIGTLTATAGKFKSGKGVSNAGVTTTVDRYFEYTITGNTLKMKESNTEAGLTTASYSNYTKE